MFQEVCLIQKVLIMGKFHFGLLLLSTFLIPKRKKKEKGKRGKKFGVSTYSFDSSLSFVAFMSVLFP